jgi:hypothetical protein
MVLGSVRLMPAFSVGVLLTAAQPVPPRTELNGLWRFTLVDPVRGVVPQSLYGGKVLKFKSAGGDLLVSDPATRTTGIGKNSDSNVHFAIPFGEAGAEGWASKDSFDFRGNISGKIIIGTSKIGDSEVRWRAVKLGSAWECSNHKNPSHIATTEEEMRGLTKQYQCAGWHKVNE